MEDADAASAAFDAVIEMWPTTIEGHITKLICIARDANNLDDWAGALSATGVALAMAKSAAAVAA
jgi:hypothetical protein